MVRSFIFALGVTTCLSSADLAYGKSNDGFWEILVSSNQKYTLPRRSPFSSLRHSHFFERKAIKPVFHSALHKRKQFASSRSSRSFFHWVQKPPQIDRPSPKSLSSPSISPFAAFVMNLRLFLKSRTRVKNPLPKPLPPSSTSSLRIFAEKWRLAVASRTGQRGKISSSPSLLEDPQPMAPAQPTRASRLQGISFRSSMRTSLKWWSLEQRAKRRQVLRDQPSTFVQSVLGLSTPLLDERRSSGASNVTGLYSEPYSSPSLLSSSPREVTYSDERNKGREGQQAELSHSFGSSPALPVMVKGTTDLSRRDGRQSQHKEPSKSFVPLSFLAAVGNVFSESSKQDESQHDVLSEPLIHASQLLVSELESSRDGERPPQNSSGEIALKANPVNIDTHAEEDEEAPEPGLKSGAMPLLRTPRFTLAGNSLSTRRQFSVKSLKGLTRVPSWDQSSPSHSQRSLVPVGLGSFSLPKPKQVVLRSPILSPHASDNVQYNTTPSLVGWGSQRQPATFMMDLASLKQLFGVRSMQRDRFKRVTVTLEPMKAKKEMSLRSSETSAVGDFRQMLGQRKSKSKSLLLLGHQGETSSLALVKTTSVPRDEDDWVMVSAASSKDDDPIIQNTGEGSALSVLPPSASKMVRGSKASRVSRNPGSETATLETDLYTLKQFFGEIPSEGDRLQPFRITINSINTDTVSRTKYTMNPLDFDLDRPMLDPYADRPFLSSDFLPHIHRTNLGGEKLRVIANYGLSSLEPESDLSKGFVIVRRTPYIMISHSKPKLIENGSGSKGSTTPGTQAIDNHAPASDPDLEGFELVESSDESTNDSQPQSLPVVTSQPQPSVAQPKSGVLGLGLFGGWV